MPPPTGRLAPLALAVLALPVAAQSPQDARETLAECLEIRASADVELRRACYYEAADAYAPYDGSDVESDAPYVPEDPTPGEAVEIALYECVSAATGTPAEAACFEAAASGYRAAIQAVERELSPFLDDAQRGAFRDAAAAWGAYRDAEAGFLEALADPARYGSADAHEDAHLDARARLVDVLRMRYEWLDAMPRG